MNRSGQSETNDDVFDAKIFEDLKSGLRAGDLSEVVCIVAHSSGEVTRIRVTINQQGFLRQFRL